MILEKNKIDILIEGLPDAKIEMVLTPYIKYQLMQDELHFINNFMKCSDIFNWNLYKNKEEVLEKITENIIRMYNDEEISFIDSGRIMVLRVHHDIDNIAEFELLTTL